MLSAPIASFSLLPLFLFEVPATTRSSSDDYHRGIVGNVAKSPPGVSCMMHCISRYLCLSLSANNTLHRNGLIFYFTQLLLLLPTRATMGMMKHKQRPDHTATMVSGIKAWTVQEKDGLKDFAMVGGLLVACFVFIRNTGLSTRCMCNALSDP